MSENNGHTGLIESKMNHDHSQIEIPGIDNKIKSFLTKVTELEKNDIILRENCKFCNHPMRQQAELKWEQTKGGRIQGSYSMVLRVFEQYEKEDPSLKKMNFTNVRNHLLNHYEQQQKKIQMREYGNYVLEVINKKIESDKMFDFLNTSLQMKYLEIASDMTLDATKQADTLIKITRIMLDILETQAKLRGDMNAVNIVVEKFTNIYANSIKHQSDPQVKKVLVENMETFRNAVCDISSAPE